MPRSLLCSASLPAACALCALLAACGSSAKQAASTPAPASTPQSAAVAGGCKKVPQPQPKTVTLPKPTARLAGGKTYVAKVVTSCGEFDITLDAKRAPRTGGSFKYLADKHFYDDLTFHRISAGFVIQGGDPKGDGTGGPGYSVVEAPPKRFKYPKYEVAMAKTAAEAPGTSGSQFFVVTADGTPLTPDYAIVGKVTSGTDVVDKIGVLPTTGQEQPVDPVVIDSVTVSGS
jgi:peptidyl-prolyl cis-trans isomerase B (cyclophilin B)